MIARRNASGSNPHPAPSRRSVTDAPSGTGERDARGVRVVVRLEEHHLVAATGQRQDRRGDRLGGAGGDEHLGVRVVVEAVVALLVGADRLSQFRDARAGRVLVVTGPERLLGGVEDLRPARRCPGSPGRG